MIRTRAGPEHVETYHRWMQDDQLLEMTGSEPLSLEEEIDMQKSWRDDEDKLTFIVLARDRCERAAEASEPETQVTEIGDGIDEGDESGTAALCIDENLDAMIGDVNLFLSEEDPDNHRDEGGDDVVDRHQGAFEDMVMATQTRRHAELDVMIAVEEYRGKGIGKETVGMMMAYGAQTLGIRRFFVKIKEENTASRALFEKSLGFKECSYAECFREYELEFKCNSAGDVVDAVKEICSLNVVERSLSLASK